MAALKRAVLPFFPSAPGLTRDARPRLVFQTAKGQFWYSCDFDPNTGRITASWIPDQHYDFTGVLVVDHDNGIITRPIDFKLPFEVFGREPTKLQWHVRILA